MTNAINEFKEHGGMSKIVNGNEHGKSNEQKQDTDKEGAALVIQYHFRQYLKRSEDEFLVYLEKAAKEAQESYKMNEANGIDLLASSEPYKSLDEKKNFYIDYLLDCDNRSKLAQENKAFIENENENRDDFAKQDAEQSESKKEYSSISSDETEHVEKDKVPTVFLETKETDSMEDDGFVDEMPEEIEAELAAIMIQIHYKHRYRRRSSAAKIIQSHYRRYFKCQFSKDNIKPEESKPTNNNVDDQLSTEMAAVFIQMHYKTRYKKRSAAAKLIQSQYRLRKASVVTKKEATHSANSCRDHTVKEFEVKYEKKQMRNTLHSGTSDASLEEQNLLNDNKAASVIQKQYRSHVKRQFTKQNIKPEVAKITCKNSENQPSPEMSAVLIQMHYKARYKKRLAAAKIIQSQYRLKKATVIKKEATHSANSGRDHTVKEFEVKYEKKQMRNTLHSGTSDAILEEQNLLNKNTAASVIQKQYRSHVKRQFMKQNIKPEVAKITCQNSENQPSPEMSAVLIQMHYKARYKKRLAAANIIQSQYRLKKASVIKKEATNSINSCRDHTVKEFEIKNEKKQMTKNLNPGTSDACLEEQKLLNDNEAASVIQKQYRSHVKRQFTKQNIKPEVAEITCKNSENQPSPEMAAVLIQMHYKARYKKRSAAANIIQSQYRLKKVPAIKNGATNSKKISRNHTGKQDEMNCEKQDIKELLHSETCDASLEYKTLLSEDEAAKVIQKQYRSHVKRQDITTEKTDDQPSPEMAAALIQMHYKARYKKRLAAAKKIQCQYKSHRASVIKGQKAIGHSGDNDINTEAGDECCKEFKENKTVSKSESPICTDIERKRKPKEIEEDINPVNLDTEFLPELAAIIIQGHYKRHYNTRSVAAKKIQSQYRSHKASAAQLRAPPSESNNSNMGNKDGLIKENSSILTAIKEDIEEGVHKPDKAGTQVKTVSSGKDNVFKGMNVKQKNKDGIGQLVKGHEVFQTRLPKIGSRDKKILGKGTAAKNIRKTNKMPFNNPPAKTLSPRKSKCMERISDDTMIPKQSNVLEDTKNVLHSKKDNKSLAKVKTKIPKPNFEQEWPVSKRQLMKNREISQKKKEKVRTSLENKRKDRRNEKKRKIDKYQMSRRNVGEKVDENNSISKVCKPNEKCLKKKQKRSTLQTKQVRSKINLNLKLFDAS